MEAKEPSLFSEWALGKCEWSDDEDSKLGTQLEPELARARIQPEQTKWLSKTTREIGKLDGSVKMELLGFLGKYGADWQDGQVLKRLALLLADGQITRTA
jgi:hypothetical protein